MPTYEYKCKDCGGRFERRQRFDDEPVKVCPECGGATQRVLHPVGIVFKGSGWYSTDNRSDGYRATNAPSEPADGKSTDGKGKADESKANGKSEASSGAKAESARPAETASR